MILDRPADDATAERIDDDGEEDESRQRRDVGDVGDPELVWPSAAKLRSTKSGAGRALRSRTVVRTPLRRARAL